MTKSPYCSMTGSPCLVLHPTPSSPPPDSTSTSLRHSHLSAFALAVPSAWSAFSQVGAWLTSHLLQGPTHMSLCYLKFHLLTPFSHTYFFLHFIFIRSIYHHLTYFIHYKLHEDKNFCLLFLFPLLHP